MVPLSVFPVNIQTDSNGKDEKSKSKSTNPSELNYIIFTFPTVMQLNKDFSKTVYNFSILSIIIFYN